MSLIDFRLKVCTLKINVGALGFASNRVTRCDACERRLLIYLFICLSIYVDLDDYDLVNAETTTANIPL